MDVIPRSFEKNTKPTMAVPPNAEKTDKTAISGGAADLSESSNGTPDVDGNEDNSTLNGSGSSGKSARDVVTPLAHMAYNDQLEHKKSSLMQILKRLVSIFLLFAYFVIFLSFASFDICFFFFLIQPLFLNHYNFFFFFLIFRLEMHVKLVLMVFHYQNGFSSLGK